MSKQLGFWRWILQLTISSLSGFLELHSDKDYRFWIFSLELFYAGLFLLLPILQLGVWPFLLWPLAGICALRAVYERELRK